MRQIGNRGSGQKTFFSRSLSWKKMQLYIFGGSIIYFSCVVMQSGQSSVISNNVNLCASRLHALPVVDFMCGFCVASCVQLCALQCLFPVFYLLAVCSFACEMHVAMVSTCSLLSPQLKLQHVNEQLNYCVTIKKI